MQLRWFGVRGHAQDSASGREWPEADWYLLRPVFAVALFLFLFAPYLVQLSGGSLLALKQQISVGRVRPGERIHRRFVVLNASLRPVTLLSVTGGCGCVA